MKKSNHNQPRGIVNITQGQLYQLINQTFQDITLCLGGVFLLHQTEDKLIWTITNSLEEIYLRTISRLGKMTGFKGIASSKTRMSQHLEGAQPHPAIEGLLRCINLKKNRSQV